MPGYAPIRPPLSRQQQVAHDDVRLPAATVARPGLSQQKTRLTDRVPNSATARAPVRDVFEANGELKPLAGLAPNAESLKSSLHTSGMSGVSTVMTGAGGVDAAVRSHWKRACAAGAAAPSSAAATYNAWADTREGYRVRANTSTASPAIRAAACSALQGSRPVADVSVARALGAGAARAAGRFTPGVTLAIAAADSLAAVEAWRDPTSPPAKKFTATLTAVGSVVAATNLPGVSPARSSGEP